MSSRDPNPEDRKRDILAAATALFARKGFEQTTMDDLAGEAGLSKGGLYWHFKSKDDVIMALLGQYLEQEIAGLEALVAADQSPSESLGLLQQMVLADLESIVRDRSLALAFYAAAIHQENVRHHFTTYYQRYRTALATIIQRGMDREEYAGVSADDVAVALIAQFEGILLLSTISPGLVDLPRQAEIATRLLLGGLRQRKE